jgi:type III restriction enzyme
LPTRQVLGGQPRSFSDVGVPARLGRRDEEDDEDQPRRRKKAKIIKRYGVGKVFPDLLSNRKGAEVTIRIDSNLLKDAESENPNASKKGAAGDLRRIVATVGKSGYPGKKIRCVVSVNMLSEGWNANNVTQILSLRAFASQLLCEQVGGRGLRRLDYAVDFQTNVPTPEYVDIFGVPFSLIPSKGRQPGEKGGDDDRPNNEVLTTHAPTIEFEIAKEIVGCLTEVGISGKKTLRQQSRSAQGVIVRYDEQAREVVGLTIVGVGRRLEEYVKTKT